MPLSDSNTFVLPSQGSAIAVSRTQFNNTLRALLQNFYSSSIPSSDNLIDTGTNMSATNYNGMFYRNSTTGMLYVSDTAITSASGRTNNPVGGSFTRYGIAWRQQGSLVAAAANISSFDVGEAFAIVRDTEGSSNNSIWMRIATTGTFDSDFVNLRAPQTNIPLSPADESVTGPKLNASLYTIPTTAMEFSSTVTMAPRLVITSFANNQNIYSTSVIELKTSTSTNDVSISFNNTVKQALLKMIPGDTGDDVRGVGVYTTDADLAPIRANVVLSSTIMGSTSETVAPLIPAGVVVAWAGAAAPSGWLECAGGAVSRTTYAALFAICSTTFGVGDGATTFNLPDARGRAIYGAYASLTRGSTSTATGTSFLTTSAATSTGISTHSYTTSTTNSTTDKDVTNSISVVTGINDHAAHTHSVTMSGISMMYIIKT